MKIIKSTLAVIAGIVTGSIINASLIFLCNIIFGSPQGMIPWDEKSVIAHADKLTTANFASILFAHQAGTMAGAFIAAKIAPFRKMIFALVVGIWFLACGIYAASLIAPPVGFTVADILLYIPFAIIGGKLGGAQQQTRN